MQRIREQRCERFSGSCEVTGPLIRGRRHPVVEGGNSQRCSRDAQHMQWGPPAHAWVPLTDCDGRPLSPLDRLLAAANGKSQHLCQTPRVYGGLCASDQADLQTKSSRQPLPKRGRVFRGWLHWALEAMHTQRRSLRHSQTVTSPPLPLTRCPAATEGRLVQHRRAFYDPKELGLGT